MNLRAEVTVEWAGASRTFRLTMAQILELEQITDAPFGALFQRVSAGQYRVADLAAIVRLGLIGGGTPAAEAAALVKRNSVPDVPLGDTWTVARLVLNATMFGFEAAPLRPLEAGEPTPGSPPPTSTGPQPSSGLTSVR